MALDFNILEDDPTTQLCMIDNTFRQVKKKRFFPTIYSTELVIPDNVNVRTISLKSCPKSLIEGFDSLQELKNSLGDIESAIIKKNNPYENIGNSIFISRAAVKLANIDAVFQLTASWAEGIIKSNHTMYFCDLAGGPGAFSQYLLWRVANSAMYGITLKSDNDNLIWSEKLTSDARFHVVSGYDGTGNLYNIDNHRDFYQKVIVDDKIAGAHIVVSDGGFETLGAECARREFLTSRLITAECFLGVSVLREGGHFVCKLYDTVTRYMRDLLYIMALLFEQISVFKPISSRPINAERYLVCKGFRKNTEHIVSILDDVFNSFTDDKYVESFINDKLPDDFIDWWRNQNILSINRQWYYTQRLLNQLSGKDVDVIRFNAHKTLILWDIPGNVDKIKVYRNRKKDSETVEQSLMNIDYLGRSPYTYHSVRDFLQSSDSKSYPYKRIYYTDEDIISMFELLRNYRQDPIYYLNRDNSFRVNNLDMRNDELVYRGFENVGTQRVIVTKEEEYYLFNVLSDMFNEEARLKAVVTGQDSSPYDCYFNNLERIANDALQKSGVITPHSLRESSYTSIINKKKACKEVTTFRPNILTYIIDMYKPKSMLDFSAGWGDRLIAAMAADISYTGVDPNKDVHKGYKKMIDFFYQVPELHIDRKKYAMIEAPFETLKASDLPNVDLVMTSPPYYDLEKYSDDESQSIMRYKSEDAWTKRFLLKALSLSVDKLNESGYLVININQKSSDQKYISEMLSAMNKKKNMTYLGVFFYAKRSNKGNKVSFDNPQPIWVWRKGEPKIHFVLISSKFRYEISNIVLDEGAMRYSKNGVAWTREEVSRFLDSHNKPDCNRYHRAVLIDGKVEGLIMFDMVDEAYHLDVMFNRRLVNKEYIDKAIDMAIDAFANVHLSVNEVYYDTILSKNYELDSKVTKKVNGREIVYNRYRITLPENRPFTFTTAFEFLSDRMYKERLTSSGWKYIPLKDAVNGCYVDLLAIGDKYEWDRSLFSISAELKQHLDTDIITNKVKLHNALSGKKYIAETYEVDNDTKIDEGIWIWRPEGEYSGQGIHIVRTQSQLDLLKEKKGERRAIISRYMTNPMLLSDGRKFHLRIFLVLMANDDEFIAIVYNEGRMGVAKKPYILDNWNDSDIHITHMTDDHLRYPRDFPAPKILKSVNRQIDKILSDVLSITYQTIKKYEESNTGYKLLGCDFLVDDKGVVSLVEINYKPGFRKLDRSTNDWISDIIANGIIEDIVLPYFEGSNPTYKYTREIFKATS